MPLIRRRKPDEKPSGASMVGVDEISNITEAPKLTLPTQKTKPVSDIENYAIYIYGPAGIGKTSFTAQFEDSLHFFYEPSGDALSLYTVEPNNWEEFLGYIQLLETQHAQGELKYKTVVIDVIDICFKQCLTYICKQGGHDYPPSDYGKTWNKISEEFRKAMYRIKKIMGLVFVSHSTEKPFERLDGSKYDTIVPTLTNTGNQVISKFCGLQCLYRMNTRGQRVLIIEPNSECEAKNRIKGHFLYTNGKHIQEIPMGDSEEQGMKNFKNAYNNKLVAPVVNKPDTSEQQNQTTIKRRS